MSGNKTTTAALIDLSSIYCKYWFAISEGPGRPQEAARATMAAIASMVQKHDVAAVCCDRGPYKRTEYFPEYKSNRSEKDPGFGDGLRDVRELIAEAGIAQYEVKGYEADDLIGKAVSMLAERVSGCMIYTGDKDMMQLVSDSVHVTTVQKMIEYGPGDVAERWGIAPAQFVDYLALVGDAADGIEGAKGIGAGNACKMINKFGSLGEIVEAAKRGELNKAGNAIEQDRMLLFQRLIQLDLSVEIDIDEMWTTKKTKRRPRSAMEASVAPIEEAAAVPTFEPGPAPDESRGQETAALTVREGRMTSAAPGGGLQPRSVEEATQVATYLYQSGFFPNLNGAQAAFALILHGQEMGVGAMQSLRSFHVIKGKVCASSLFLVALCKADKTGVCEYFRCAQSDEKSATWETRERGAEPMRVAFTIEQARKAGLVGKDNWRMYPEDMLNARASARLARLVYPQIISGMYATEEMGDAQ